MREFNYPENRDWMAEYALREFEDVMAKTPSINKEGWTIQIDTGSLNRGYLIDHEHKFFTVLIPDRQ